MFAFIGALIGWIWDGIQIAADAIVAGLVWVVSIIQTALGATWAAGKWFFQNVIEPVAWEASKAYDRLRKIYERFAAPAIGWLRRVTATTRRIYNTFIAPILTTIDGVRKIAQLLALLHIEWAKKLDAELAQLEQKISAPVQLVIQTINRIDSRIEGYILTVDNLFKKVTLLGSIGRDIASVSNMTWNASLKQVYRYKDFLHVEPAPLSSADEHLQVLDDVFSGRGNAFDFDPDRALTLLEDVFAGNQRLAA